MKKQKLKRGPWTKDELKQLKQYFRDNPTANVAAWLNRPTEAVKKKASRMGLTKTKTYMKSLGRTVCLLFALLVFTSTARADDANDVTGATAWVLGGSGVQELRVGYEGLLPDIEVAVGGRHTDAPDPAADEWSARGYLLAHALDAEMLASAAGNKIVLPDGNLYAGLFAEYSHDRENEWSGGYVIGGLVSWPRGWQTVVEYDATIFNASNNEYEIVLGLRRLF